MAEREKKVWVKRHGPSNTWYVLCDWLFGAAGVDSYFESIDDAIARAKEVAAEHDAELMVFGASAADS